MEQTPSKAAILGSLSQALDLVEGQLEGHAMRTSLLSLRIAQELHLSVEEQEDVYFASVLKDSGCSNNSVRILKIFGGDELVSKRKVKFIDWSSTVESLKFAIVNTEPDGTISDRLRRMAANLGPPQAIMNEVTSARCTRGAFIAQMLNFRRSVADAILNLDEHWDGKGSPLGHRGHTIPVISRILCLTQTFDVFRSAFGLAAAQEIVRKRAKRWFDPEVAAVCRTFKDTDPLWEELDSKELGQIAEQRLPWLATSAMDTDIDAICKAFAMIIDAKSSFTAEHSDRVTEYAVKLGSWLGLGSERLRTLKRACLMHDVGKLGVSSSILEKPGRLTVEEFDQIKRHPYHSDVILRRIPTWDTIADIASAHHERLDGKGYWRGLESKDLTQEIRITTACDVFDALTAKRPYREAMPVAQAFEIMDRDLNSAFDPDCLHGLKELYTHREHMTAAIAA